MSPSTCLSPPSPRVVPSSTSRTRPRIRYDFAFILPQRWDGASVKTPFGNTPLTAWEYAAFYDRGGLEWSYLAEDDDTVAAKAHAHLTETFRGQGDTKATMIASPVIDEDTLENAWPSPGDQQSWGRRADLGLPEVTSPVNDTPPLSVPVVHNTEALYKAFEQSYRLFEPGYNEGLDTEIPAPVSPVKQVMNILYLEPLEKSSWQARAAEYEPKSTQVGENAVREFHVPGGRWPRHAGADARRPAGLDGGGKHPRRASRREGLQVLC